MENTALVSKIQQARNLRELSIIVKNIDKSVTKDKGVINSIYLAESNSGSTKAGFTSYDIEIPPERNPIKKGKAKKIYTYDIPVKQLSDNWSIVNRLENNLKLLKNCEYKINASFTSDTYNKNPRALLDEIVEVKEKLIVVKNLATTFISDLAERKMPEKVTAIMDTLFTSVENGLRGSYSNTVKSLYVKPVSINNNLDNITIAFYCYLTINGLSTSSGSIIKDYNIILTLITDPHTGELLKYVTTENTFRMPGAFNKGHLLQGDNSEDSIKDAKKELQKALLFDDIDIKMSYVADETLNKLPFISSVTINSGVLTLKLLVDTDIKVFLPKIKGLIKTLFLNTRPDQLNIKTKLHRDSEESITLNVSLVTPKLNRPIDLEKFNVLKVSLGLDAEQVEAFKSSILKI